MYRFSLINDILKHNLEIKKIRSEIKHETFQDFEKPREIYLKTCLTIANYFREYGFEFSKSSVCLVKEIKEQNLRFRIRFQSDYNNIAGVYVGLSVGFGVEDIGLKRWQKKNGIPGQNPGEQIFGAGLSYFSKTDKMLISWNVVNENEREIAIIEIIDILENELIPFFNLFLDVDLISTLLVNGNFFFDNPLVNVQYLLFHKSNREAVIGIKNYLQTNKTVMEQYLNDRIPLKSESLNILQSGLHYNLAYVVLFYNLGDITTLI